MKKNREKRNPDRWIPIAERFPKELETEDILVSFESGYVTTSIVLSNGIALDGWKYGKIVAWRELPTPFRWWKKGRKKSTRWISVKVRKPSWREVVLAQYANGKVYIEFASLESLEPLYGKVLYWMPLPEPYTEVKA